ncbi:MAG: four helix bundle protein [Planctomycetota bacterium]|jgi:four helix bundle protein|nr:four helix bundle protein [Planctomycetota bacterium]MDP6502018.1 four helix bundle protein [Planctomycetota bacterium]
MASFHHENLVVYQRSIKFVAWSRDLLKRISAKASAKDHLHRASASVPQNIAESNAKRSPKEQCRFVDIANGSALECSACLDVLQKKKLLTEELRMEGRELLFSVVQMLVGLRRSKKDRVEEESSIYGTPRFDHEKLEAYQTSLQAVEWLNEFFTNRELDAQSIDTLDRTSTSVALNIAEGNAKFSVKDRCRFIDTSISSGLRCAGALDVSVASGEAEPDEIMAGKELLRITVSLLSGLRRRLEEMPPDWGD